MSVYSDLLHCSKNYRSSLVRFLEEAEELALEKENISCEALALSEKVERFIERIRTNLEKKE